MFSSKFGFWPHFLIWPLLIWSLFWKGMALWRSARDQQKEWFLILLVLNTAGILEIVYLFFFAKEKLTLSSLSLTGKKKKSRT
ncbi:hypothetical protein A2191_03930 [Candidatus Woesebacteria bacterium RIFOXYA1_FULL_38_9]|nr:MAG: hypothetical protein A2191_03930 [Candidatus Woesebacteria bacterium RIFOXYA1_FULL_38_9]